MADVDEAIKASSIRPLQQLRNAYSSRPVSKEKL